MREEKPKPKGVGGCQYFKCQIMRENILQKIKQNQPSLLPLPDLSVLGSEGYGVEKYIEVLHSIGGKAIEVSDFEEIKAYIKGSVDTEARVISTLQELNEVAETDWLEADPHSLENVDLAIIQAQFGVAENSALWVTNEQMGQRVAPFITQHLAIVVESKNIVPTMHQAYELISSSDYGFGIFIAGPSKTADIEQSLVLGAHGARSLTVFILG